MSSEASNNQNAMRKQKGGNLAHLVSYLHRAVLPAQRQHHQPLVCFRPTVKVAQSTCSTRRSHPSFQKRRTGLRYALNAEVLYYRVEKTNLSMSLCFLPRSRTVPHLQKYERSKCPRGVFAASKRTYSASKLLSKRIIFSTGLRRHE